MLLLAPAKINLTLKVLSKRADGYHEISSLMRAIRLFDEVEIALSFGGDKGIRESGISVRTDMPGVPDGPDNLAYRAAELALKNWDRNLQIEAGGDTRQIERVDIKLIKNIPAAAGLAGGSADAAAVLLGLAKELVPSAELSAVSALGAALGADIPFCVYSCAAANPALGYKGAGSALTCGTGERITPISNPGQAWVVLVKAPIEIRASEVYALYDAWDLRKAPVSLSDNDLEAPCARAWPLVAEQLEKLKNICAEEGAGKAKVQLSGSGPTIFAYFDKELNGYGRETAARIYDRAKTALPGMWILQAEVF